LATGQLDQNTEVARCSGCDSSRMVKQLSATYPNPLRLSCLPNS